MKAKLRISYKIKFLILLSLVLFGCSESWLDYDKRGSQIPDTFYKTDAQAFEGLAAAFDRWQSGIGFNYYYLHLGLSDENYAGGGSRGDNGGILEEINEYRFTPDNTGIRGHYQWLYQCVYRANLVINRVTPDTENKKIDVAMAKVLRAYAYFFLVNMWGDVPLVLAELSADEYNQPRTPAADIYAQIEKDLTEAIADLPVRGNLTGDYVNLISKGAAQSILGKAYLFQKKYSEAAAIFDQVITSGDYDLYPDYSKVLRKDSEYGVESVWEIPFITNQNYTSFPGSESGMGVFLIFVSPRETQFYCPSLGIAQPMGWCFLNPHKEVYDAYINAGDNVRRQANIISKTEIETLGGYLQYPAPPSTGYTPYGNDGYIQLRYVNYLTEGEGVVDWFKLANNGTNARMVRFADVLLMAAEANNKKTPADDVKARTYLNRVRTRVSLPDVTSSGEELFAAIKLERKLELFYEGGRYLDLQRWQGDLGTSGEAYLALKDQGKSVPSGVPGAPILQPDAGYKTGKNELLPIPSYEMQVNAEMTQNPGY
ncbi:MAG: RagB/SusD family nutrient uptake outer membrane protein [Bacteroidota bacterium]